MANVLVEETSLSSIASAIREKNGTENTYKPGEMAAAISEISVGSAAVVEELNITANGTYTVPEGVDGYSPVVVNVPQDGAPPEEALVITGDTSYRFAYNGWNWFIDKYGNQITTKDIITSSRMFNFSTKLKKIPFNLNFKNTTSYQTNYMFCDCSVLEEIGDICNCKSSTTSNIFANCQRLRYLPNFINCDFSIIQSGAYNDMASMFKGCYSLRSIPESFTNLMWGMQTSSYYCAYNQAFNGCYVLDEIIGLGVHKGTITSNIFNNTFYNCNRLKDITFKMNEDGTPQTANWKSQTIDLTMGVGYVYSSETDILNYNSGITKDKAVNSAADYERLKDDADWYAGPGMVSCSRYNHDSAVRTINSLPDTSAYLATAGGTNTIKFKTNSGKNAGGAISELTEEEIAVATAKGWTVTFV